MAAEQPKEPEDLEDEGAAARRRPGRPPVKHSPDVPREGIVAEAPFRSALVEARFDCPATFKSLFTFFKGMKVKMIYFDFSEAGMVVYALDASTKSRIRIWSDGAKMNRYYCKKPITVPVLRSEYMERCFSNIKTQIYVISFYIRDDDPENLTVKYVNSIYGNESKYDFKVCQGEVIPPALLDINDIIKPEALLTDYPLSFELSSKEFKGTITDVAGLPYVDIEKVGPRPMHFEYSKTNEMKYNNIWRFPEKIKLLTSVKDDEAFRCKMLIPNVKPLAISMVTDCVRIYCKAGGGILFKSVMDNNIIEIAVYVNMESDP